MARPTTSRADALYNTDTLTNPENAAHLGAAVPAPITSKPTNPAGNASVGTFHQGGHQSATPAPASAGSSGFGQAVAVAQLHNSLRYDAQTPATPPSARELALAQHHVGTANCPQCHAFLVGVARGSLHAAIAPATAQPRRQATPSATRRGAPGGGPYVSATVAKRAAEQRAQRAAEAQPRTGARRLC